MPKYDPSDPASWPADEPVDAAEIGRRMQVVNGKGSAGYVARNLSRQESFPAQPRPYPMNGGRWWKWGDVSEWLRSTGRMP